ncbi:tetratricopeptide repeat protein [Planktomarina sp.]|nr:tetratricopeptide repeat protein [Planktomarina sp.]
MNNDATEGHSNILSSLTLEQAQRLAKKKLKEGSSNDAMAIYLAILAKFPKNKKARDGLKALSGGSNSKQTIVQGVPQDQLNLLVQLYSQGQFQQVLDTTFHLLKQFPKSVTLFNISGAAHAGLGQHTDAITSYKKAITIEPNYVDAYYNLGFALREKGNLEEAVKNFNKVILLNPNYVDAYNNVAVTLEKQGKLEEAVISYNKAISIKPDYADAYFNMASTLEAQGKLEEAIGAYKKTLDITPDYSAAWSNGARALEGWNKLEQLDLWLKKAFNECKILPPELQFQRAKLLWRNKEYERTTDIINAINFDLITDNLKKECLNLEAKCFEALKDFDKAYKSFEEMNSLAKKSSEFEQCNPKNYLQEIRNQLAKLNSRPAPIFPDYKTPQPNYDPAFLVGFPRSGTTLLDTILRSHSCVEVVEEKPTTKAAQTFIYKNNHTDIVNQLLPSALLSGARKAYRAELNKHLSKVNSNSVCIDKLPLNLVKAPLINHLYPKAKFILALRHPMDTILSCWMQNFALNPAMAVMTDLDQTVDLYCLGMETFKKAWTDYNLNVHLIKYEDLLENLAEETTALLQFLDLDWEPQMKDYQDTAIKRGKINTPSYSQVVQPIYKSAKYRWLKYEKYLDKYLEQVTPWIDEFGYEGR